MDIPWTKEELMKANEKLFEENKKLKQDIRENRQWFQAASSNVQSMQKEIDIYKGSLEKIVTRSMSMYGTKDDMLKDLFEIAWKAIETEKAPTV